MKATTQTKVLNKVHVEGFNEWMLKIRNVHYADNKQMTKAYDKVISNTNRE